MTSPFLSGESSLMQLRQSPRLSQLPRSGSFVEFNEEEIEQSISARFEKQVEQYPDRVAVQTSTGTLTYEALNQGANRIAHALLQRRPPGQEPIAFLLEDSVTQIFTPLGVLKAGKIYSSLYP